MVIEILEMRGDPGAVEGEGDPSRLARGIMGCPFAPALVAASLSDPNPSMWSCLLHMDGFFIVDFMPVSMQRQLPS